MKDKKIIITNKEDEKVKDLLFGENKFEGVVVDAEKRAKLEMLFQITEGLEKLTVDEPFIRYECKLMSYDSSHKHSGVMVTFDAPVMLKTGLIKSAISNMASISDEIDVLPIGGDDEDDYEDEKIRFIFIVNDLWR